MWPFKREELRDERAVMVKFAGDEALVLGKAARDLRELRTGWHGPWAVVVLRRSDDNKVIYVQDKWVNLAVATSLTDVTVRVGAEPPEKI